MIYLIVGMFTLGYCITWFISQLHIIKTCIKHKTNFYGMPLWTFLIPLLICCICLGIYIHKNIIC